MKKPVYVSLSTRLASIESVEDIEIQHSRAMRQAKQLKRNAAALFKQIRKTPNGVLLYKVAKTAATHAERVAFDIRFAENTIKAALLDKQPVVQVTTKYLERISHF